MSALQLCLLLLLSCVRAFDSLEINLRLNSVDGVRVLHPPYHPPVRTNAPQKSKYEPRFTSSPYSNFTIPKIVMVEDAELSFPIPMDILGDVVDFRLEYQDSSPPSWASLKELEVRSLGSFSFNNGLFGGFPYAVQLEPDAYRNGTKVSDLLLWVGKDGTPTAPGVIDFIGSLTGIDVTSVSEPTEVSQSHSGVRISVMTRHPTLPLMYAHGVECGCLNQDFEPLHQFKVIDTADLEELRVITSFNLSLRAHQNDEMVIHGSFVYVAHTYGGLSVVNIQDPYHPVPGSFIPFDDTYFALDIFEDTLYIGGFDGLRAFNISNGANPVDMGIQFGLFNSFIAYSDIYVEEKQMMIALYYEGVRVVDLESGSTLQMLPPSSEDAKTVEARHVGKHLLVVETNVPTNLGGLLTVYGWDSFSSKYSHLAAMEISYDSYAMAVSEGYAFIPDTQVGVQFVEFEDTLEVVLSRPVLGNYQLSLVGLTSNAEKRVISVEIEVLPKYLEDIRTNLNQLSMLHVDESVFPGIVLNNAELQTPQLEEVRKEITISRSPYNITEEIVLSIDGNVDHISGNDQIAVVTETISGTLYLIDFSNRASPTARQISASFPLLAAEVVGSYLYISSGSYLLIVDTIPIIEEGIIPAATTIPMDGILYKFVRKGDSLYLLLEEDEDFAFVLNLNVTTPEDPTITYYFPVIGHPSWVDTDPNTSNILYTAITFANSQVLVGYYSVTPTDWDILTILFVDTNILQFLIDQETITAVSASAGIVYYPYDGDNITNWSGNTIEPLYTVDTDYARSYTSAPGNPKLKVVSDNYSGVAILYEGNSKQIEFLQHFRTSGMVTCVVFLQELLVVANGFGGVKAFSMRSTGWTIGVTSAQPFREYVRLSGIGDDENEHSTLIHVIVQNWEVVQNYAIRSTYSNTSFIGILPRNGVVSKFEGKLSFAASTPDFNINPPPNPKVQKVGSFLRDLAFELMVRAPYLLVASGESGVVVVDVSDPSNPRFVTNANLNYAREICEHANGDLLVTDPYNGIYILRFSKFALAFEVLGVVTPEVLGFNNTDIIYFNSAVSISPSQIIVCVDLESREGQVSIVDISIPSAPKLQVRVPAPHEVRRAVYRNGYAFVAAGIVFDTTSGMLVINFKNFSNSYISRVIPTSGWETYAIDIGDNRHICLGDFFGSVTIYDINNPENPLPVHTFETNGRLSGLYYDADLRIIIASISDKGFQILDLEDIYHIRALTIDNLDRSSSLNELDTPGDPGAIIYHGGFLYVPDYSSGVTIFKCSIQQGWDLASTKPLPIGNHVVEVLAMDTADKVSQFSVIIKIVENPKGYSPEPRFVPVTGEDSLELRSEMILNTSDLTSIVAIDTDKEWLKIIPPLLPSITPIPPSFNFQVDQMVLDGNRIYALGNDGWLQVYELEFINMTMKHVLLEELGFPFRSISVANGIILLSHPFVLCLASVDESNQLNILTIFEPNEFVLGSCILDNKVILIEAEYKPSGIYEGLLFIYKFTLLGNMTALYQTHRIEIGEVEAQTLLWKATS